MEKQAVQRGREIFYQIERPRNPPRISLNGEGLHQFALCRHLLMYLLTADAGGNVPE